MKPTTLSYQSEHQRLEIEWEDGKIQIFPVDILRGFCPCATCQGHGGGLPTFIKLQRPRGLEIENITPVGNYGMCVIWGDGHDTGIYSFRSLLQIDLDYYAQTQPEEGDVLQLKK